MTNEDTPYIGPRPFGRNESGFFGRDSEAQELLSLIIAHPAVLLYAPSGAGKTSLINAGLIPLLEDRDVEVLGLARVRGEPSQTAPANIQNIFTFNTLLSLQPKSRDLRNLGAVNLQGYLKRKKYPAPTRRLARRRVIIFDQFEEIFNSYPEHWRERAAFLDDIAQALNDDSRLRIVFAMREEYIASLDPYAGKLPEKLQISFRLEPLRSEAAFLAVTRPLEGTGRKFAPSAAERLIENLSHLPVKSSDGMSVASGEFVEPLQLQIVCQRLWRSLPEYVETIDENYIRDYGDVDQALAHYYESCIAEVVHRCGADESLLRAWFEDALITPEGTRGLVYRDSRTTREVPNKWVDALEGLHLIRAEMRSGARWYELIHDRFINPIRLANKAWRKQKARRLLSDAEIESWIEFRAFKQMEVRKLTTQLGRPERIWHKFLDDPGTSRDHVLQDWWTAEHVFALEVLEGGVQLSSRVGPNALKRLENEWLSKVKRTKAYLLWEEGNVSSDASHHESDYYRACESFRKRLVDPEIKSQVEDFHPIEEYLRANYLDSRGRFDAGKKPAKALLDVKAYRIYTHSREDNADLNFSHALGYAKMFYDNVLPAVKGDEESTLLALKAFQYSKAPENRYLIINCLETAIAIYFFDAAMIRKFWEESSEQPGSQPYTLSTITVEGWTGSWSPPLRFADRLRFDKGTLVLRGMLRQSERDQLLADAPPELASGIEELYRHSRLLPEETTL